MAYTADTLIAAVRRRVRLPDDVGGTNPSLTDSELLLLADEAMLAELVPYVLRHREEYYVTQTTYTLTSSTTYVDIPARAYMGSIRDVRVKTSGTNATEYSLPRLEVDYASENPFGGDGFSLRDNRIYLWPSTGYAGTILVVDYYYMPGRLVTTSSADTLGSAASENATSLSLSGTPNVAWGSESSCDLIGATSPHVFYEAATIDSYSSPTITLSSGVTQDLPAGTYVATEGTSPVPQLPGALYPLLVVLTSLKAAEALGEAQKAASLQTEASRMFSLYTPMLRGRTVGASRKCVNWNTPLRGGSGRWRGE